MAVTTFLRRSLSVQRGGTVALISWGIVGLVFVRLCVAWAGPLANDEAYYWLWSRHLAAGYYDHPPMVAVLIRLSTAIFGDTPFGIRALSVLLGLVASWAVWRATVALYASETLGAFAALYFNLTLFAAAGTVIVTPDAPLLVASAFVLLFLAKVLQTGRGGWWLAVGAAAGLALVSKYTALFFGLGIVLWLLWEPALRRWLWTPWPYLGGLVALAIFAPVLLWNAGHDWISFLKQGARVGIRGDFTLRYLGEHFAAQFGMATPSVLVLGLMGLFAMLRGQGGPRAARLLIAVLIWPLALYFLWHAIHSRVEGNWTAPLIPAFAVAAAVAAHRIDWRGRSAQVAGLARRSAVPVGLGLAGLIYLQAVFGMVPAGVADPTARQLGAGWPALAARIDALRREAGARGVLGTNYGTVGWLAFYLPDRPPVVQVNERIRWIDAPEPDPALFEGAVLYVCKAPCAESETVTGKFERVARPVTLPRLRRGGVIEEYLVWRLAGLQGDLLDRCPPPELR